MRKRLEACKSCQQSSLKSPAGATLPILPIYLKVRVGPGVLGVSPHGITQAFASKEFEIPGLGKCRVKAREKGKGGLQNGKLGWANWLDLYSKVCGIPFAAACSELRKSASPSPHIFPASTNAATPTAAVTDQPDEPPRIRFTDKGPVSGMGLGYLSHFHRGTSPESWAAHDARDGRWKQYEKSQGQSVVGIPAYDFESLEAIDHEIFDAAGGKIRYRDQDPKTGEYFTSLEKVMHAEKSSRECILCSVESLEWLRTQRRIDGLIAVKTEGPKDLLVAWELARQSDRTVLVFTNLFGCRTLHSADVMLSRLKAMGCETFMVMHDADHDGQDGARKWADAASPMFREVRNLQLPYEVTEKRGKDLRDWVVEAPRTWTELINLPTVQGGAK